MGFEVSLRESPTRLVLIVSALPKGPKERVRIEVRDDDANGRLRFEETRTDLSHSTKRRALIRDINTMLGVTLTDQQLLQWLEDYREWLQEPEGADAGLFRIIVRRMDAPAASGHIVDHAEPLGAFRVALERAIVETNVVMEWSKDRIAELAVLDVDYHTLDVRLGDDYLTAVAESLRPKPVCWWISHGGGLHAIYAELKPYTAEELAACAAFALGRVDPTCTTEILTRSRHPKSRRE